VSKVHIYVIGTYADPDICKIGLALEPKKRLAQLQTGAHEKLFIAATFECESREIARHRERQAHKTFDGCRTSGEWFGISPAIVCERSVDWFFGKPQRPKPAAEHSQSKSEYVPFHPNIPDDLFGIPISQMVYEDRVRFWAACGLEPPPEGFDDWYLIGSQKSGVMGAIPVEGFVCQEPKQ
jgi:T5orf172 domain